MSQPPPQASSIPNLSTLRGQRGGLRGLAARRRGAPPTSDHVTTQEDEDPQVKRDQIIQQTDNDASSSRMSAVALGYMNDEFAKPFISEQIPRRYPIINRGTYVRTTAIDRLVDSFLNTYPHGKKQIISLGAGSDTRFFRRARPNLVYHELDFPSNTAAKIAVINRERELLLNTIVRSLADQESITTKNGTAFYSETLNVHPIDLRTLDATIPPTHLPNLDPSLPTLLLSECCLCYIPPETTTQILSYFTAAISGPLALVLYEPIRPYDSFGKTMIANLFSRGIELRTVKKYFSLAAQRERLRQAGFTAGQGARSVEDIYYGEERHGETWLDEQERRRIERLEWLDEVEEWRLLSSHYCIAWAWRDGGGEEGNVFSTAWRDIKGGRVDSERVDDEIM